MQTPNQGISPPPLLTATPITTDIKNKLVVTTATINLRTNRMVINSHIALKQMLVCILWVRQSELLHSLLCSTRMMTKRSCCKSLRVRYSINLTKNILIHIFNRRRDTFYSNLSSIPNKNNKDGPSTKWKKTASIVVLNLSLKHRLKLLF